MGQGNFIAIGYGILDPPVPKEEVLYRWLPQLKKAAGRPVHLSYESRREYLAIFLAENCGVDDNAKPIETCALSDFLQDAQRWDDAIAVWRRVRKESKRFGIDLPWGAPLLIADCD